MREIHVNEIISALEGLFIDANRYLPESVYEAFEKSIEKE
jgi:fumarate hydratase subunit alpha